MASIIKLEYCPCCGTEQDTKTFALGTTICGKCAILTPDSVAKLTRATVTREYAYLTKTAEGRKKAKARDRLAKIDAMGKRCSACHHLKPAGAYNKSARASDTLQPVCRTCNEIRVTALKNGGLALWHTLLASLRATSPEGK